MSNDSVVRHNVVRESSPRNQWIHVAACRGASKSTVMPGYTLLFRGRSRFENDLALQHGVSKILEAVAQHFDHQGRI